MFRLLLVAVLLPATAVAGDLADGNDALHALISAKTLSGAPLLVAAGNDAAKQGVLWLRTEHPELSLKATYLSADTPTLSSALERFDLRCGARVDGLGDDVYEVEFSGCGPAPAAAAASEAPAVEADLEEVEVSTYHGFRVGYTYLNLGPDYTGLLKSPHLMTIGYELTQRISGGEWLDVIVVENATLSGLDQNLFIPSLNFLVGFEVANQIQVGLGPHILPFAPDGQNFHMMAAVGYTPKVGAFNMPVHMMFIPDPAGNFRVGATVGVNWK